MHNYLLGGGGNDTIYAGNDGDVIWGDSHPGEQPTSQRDYLHGGEGEDWIYASYGENTIWTGAGNDHVALVYGHGTVLLQRARPEDARDALPAAEPAVEARRLRSQGDRALQGVGSRMASSASGLQRRGRGRRLAVLRIRP